MKINNDGQEINKLRNIYDGSKKPRIMIMDMKVYLCRSNEKGTSSSQVRASAVCVIILLEYHMPMLSSRK